MGQAHSSTPSIVSYVLNSIVLLLVLYCLFALWNMKRKVNSVADFVNGEVFSEKFQMMLNNFFANQTNTRRVFEPIASLMRDILAHRPPSSSPSSSSSSLSSPDAIHSSSSETDEIGQVGLLLL